MSAKEKAKELVNKFQQEYLIVVEMTERKMYNHEAKQCALIAVDEILNHHSQEQGLYRIDTYYWQQVKTEIGNL